MSADNSHCQVCGKPAIGMQILGCCQSVVCSEHAEKILVSMVPGERQEWGSCYFWRFTEGDV